MIRRSRIEKTHRSNHTGVLSGYTYLAGTTFQLSARTLVEKAERIDFFSPQIFHIEANRFELLARG
jgi:hypothetical protein